MLHRWIFILLLFAACQPAQPEGKAVPARLMTRWASQVTPKNSWPEYPRPQLQRQSWSTLNGLWQYALQPRSATQAPKHWEGQILVPFAIESALSGVGKRVGEDTALWYSRIFEVPANGEGKNLLLHFEAVDWETKVWVNGKKVGEHRGGYDPFSFDLTPFLNPEGEQELLVSVWDPTDTGTQPRGKQVNEPGGIFYTPVTGIWQTVWLELVPETYIRELKLTPDLKQMGILLATEIENGQEGDSLLATIGQKQFRFPQTGGFIPLPEAKLWSPEHPHLYDLELSLRRDGKIVDEVSSYFGMRKVSLGKDAQGITRILLNGEFVFQNGLLDQGFWPDGIYTAPTDEALRFDLEAAKSLGFNLLRKHVKVEPRRWYYWADKLGILVWQDMPSGDRSIGPDEPDITRTPESAGQYEQELKAMISHLHNHPSIIVWVPFNEGWGQYETGRITDLVKSLDSSRLVNSTSGWSDRGSGDILDLHHYPDPVPVLPEVTRAAALGEFGGLGLPVEGHLWEATNWGYQGMENPEKLLLQYEQFYTRIWQYKTHPGLSAAIYTQLTDVETETNGLLTYDRALIKADSAALRKINLGDFVASPVIDASARIFYRSMKVTLAQLQGFEIRYTIDGSDPDISDYLYQQPLTLTTDMHIRARAFSPQGEGSFVSSASFSWRKDPPPVYTNPYSPRYSAGGDYGLVDGQRGSTRFGDGRWQGFEGQDLELTLDLGELQRLRRLSAGFLEDTRAWIFLPKEVEWAVSQDGKTYEVLKTFVYEMPAAHRDAHIEKATVAFSPMELRYVRLRAINQGVCPEWHPGAGGKTWIFVDEVERE